MSESGFVNWPAASSQPLWTFSWQLMDGPDDEGIAILDAFYKQRHVFDKASLAAFRTHYPALNRFGQPQTEYKIRDDLPYNNAIGGNLGTRVGLLLVGGIWCIATLEYFFEVGPEEVALPAAGLEADSDAEHGPGGTVPGTPGLQRGAVDGRHLAFDRYGANELPRAGEMALAGPSLQGFV
jgi:hypothetical protein